MPKVLKSLLRLLSLMPMPVSETVTVRSILSVGFFATHLSTLIVIAPLSVNLKALPRRLVRTYRMRFLSEVMKTGSVEGL